MTLASASRADNFARARQLLAAPAPRVGVQGTKFVGHRASAQLYDAIDRCALAVAGSRRFEALPEVPTIAETLPGYEARTWAGVGVRKGTPTAMIARLDREIAAVLVQPTIEARLADLGTMPMPLNAQEFAAFIAAESEKWGKVVRIANIAVQ